MKQHENDLITVVMPWIGRRMPVQAYKEVLMQNGYTLRQAVCSIAGSMSAGTIRCYGGILVRVK